MKTRIVRHLIAGASLLALAACGESTLWNSGAFTANRANVSLPEGPPIEDVKTPFDEALMCLRGRIRPEVVFGVGQVVDATGKETFSDGGTGKFITQGAGEMLQTALFRAGVTVVNRRDTNIAVTEANWGLRSIRDQLPAHFYISGSINSLDFIPGGGFSARVNNIGPRQRQNRILIALDLTMTDAATGRVVANVPLQKQIFTRESGFGTDHFFGNTLLSFDIGGMEREATHFALRQMLSLATFELLGQLMHPSVFAPCRIEAEVPEGTVRGQGTADPEAIRHVQEAAVRDGPPGLALESGTARSEEQAQQQAAAQQQALQQALEAAQQQAAAQQQQAAAQQQQAAQQQAARQQAAQQPTQAARSIEEQVKELANHVMVFGARAVAAAEESLAAQSTDVAAEKAAEATELLRGAVQILQRAAELGLDGPEGDAAAMVVERGMAVVAEAQEGLAARMEAPRENTGSDAGELSQPPASEEGTDAARPSPPPSPAPSGPPRPGTPEAQRLGITE